MSDSESDEILVIGPPTAVTAASADQGNRRRERHREDAQHSGARGPQSLTALVSWFQGRWVEELASATEAGRSLAALRVDAHTWHGFSEEFDDVAPPSRDHAREIQRGRTDGMVM